MCHEAAEGECMVSTEEEKKMVLDQYVHGPDRLASGYVEFAREVKGADGVTFGCVLDDYLLPLRPGRTLTIVARPGQLKTGLSGALIKREGLRLQRLGIQDRYAAHVSWEQPVEELEAMFHQASGYSISDIAWGRVNVDEIIRNTTNRPALPVWIFGESVYNTDFDTPPMTIDRVLLAIEAVYEKWGKLPSLMAFDYLQDIPVPDERDRYNQVSAAMRRVRRLAVQAKCPILVGVQASARVDAYEKPIPTLGDAEWSNVIGQKTDAQIALWYPIKTHHPNDHPTIEVGGVTYPNTDELLVVKLLKQRFERGYGIWGVKFNPATLELGDWSKTELDFDSYWNNKKPLPIQEDSEDEIDKKFERMKRTYKTKHMFDKGD